MLGSCNLHGYPCKTKLRTFRHLFGSRGRHSRPDGPLQFGRRAAQGELEQSPLTFGCSYARERPNFRERKFSPLHRRADLRELICNNDNGLQQKIRGCSETSQEPLEGPKRGPEVNGGSSSGRSPSQRQGGPSALESRPVLGPPPQHTRQSCPWLDGTTWATSEDMTIDSAGSWYSFRLHSGSGRRDGQV